MNTSRLPLLIMVRHDADSQAAPKSVPQSSLWTTWVSLSRRQRDPLSRLLSRVSGVDCFNYHKSTTQTRGTSRQVLSIYKYRCPNCFQIKQRAAINPHRCMTAFITFFAVIKSKGTRVTCFRFLLNQNTNNVTWKHVCRSLTLRFMSLKKLVVSFLT